MAGDLQESGRTGGGTWLSVGIPLVGFVIVVGAALFLWSGQQGKLREHQQQVERSNAGYGLPADFPSDVIPLFEGAEVTSTETGVAESVEGEPMDMWKVVARVDSDDRKQIFDYYNDVLLDRGFRQTQVISMPSHDASGPNYAVDYGSEQMSLSLIIEKKSSDEMTQLAITVYRVR